MLSRLKNIIEAIKKKIHQINNAFTLIYKLDEKLVDLKCVLDENLEICKSNQDEINDLKRKHYEILDFYDVLPLSEMHNCSNSVSSGKIYQYYCNEESALNSAEDFNTSVILQKTRLLNEISDICSRTTLVDRDLKFLLDNRSDNIYVFSILSSDEEEVDCCSVYEISKKSQTRSLVILDPIISSKIVRHKNFLSELSVKFLDGIYLVCSVVDSHNSFIVEFDSKQKYFSYGDKELRAHFHKSGFAEVTNLYDFDMGYGSIDTTISVSRYHIIEGVYYKDKSERTPSEPRLRLYHLQKLPSSAKEEF